MDLPFTAKDQWRSRWVHVGGGRVIHRVQALECSPEEWDDNPLYQDGKTVCGREGKIAMPGILSRMHAPRCKACCKAIDIPQGAGAPFNEGLDA